MVELRLLFRQVWFVRVCQDRHRDRSTIVQYFGGSARFVDIPGMYIAQELMARKDCVYCSTVVAVGCQRQSILNNYAVQWDHSALRLSLPVVTMMKFENLETDP